MYKLVGKSVGLLRDLSRNYTELEECCLQLLLRVYLTQVWEEEADLSCSTGRRIRAMSCILSAISPIQCPQTAKIACQHLGCHNNVLSEVYEQT